MVKRGRQRHEKMNIKEMHILSFLYLLNFPFLSLFGNSHLLFPLFFMILHPPSFPYNSSHTFTLLFLASILSIYIIRLVSFEKSCLRVLKELSCGVRKRVKREKRNRASNRPKISPKLQQKVQLIKRRL